MKFFNLHTSYDANRAANNKGRSSCTQGFTLVELLVVITIITIMVSVGAIGLKNLAKSGGVPAAVPTAQSLFSQAQSLAIGKASNARVLVNADQDDHDRYLRYLIVAYEFEDENGGSKWVTESRGVYLPQGVYFSQKYSSLDHTSGTGTLNSFSEGIFGGVNDASANELLSVPYYYYEFNSEGNASDPGASFLVSVGSRAPGQKNPRLTVDALKDFGGFVVSKVGSLSAFRHPDQIGLPPSLKPGAEF